eukprot:3302650-Prymnesium_polylepis.1
MLHNTSRLVRVNLRITAEHKSAFVALNAAVLVQFNFVYPTALVTFLPGGMDERFIGLSFMKGRRRSLPLSPHNSFYLSKITSEPTLGIWSSEFIPLKARGAERRRARRERLGTQDCCRSSFFDGPESPGKAFDHPGLDRPK